MKALFTSEWERLWSRSFVAFALFSMPILNVVLGFYYQFRNQSSTEEAVNYATVMNFPVLSLSEHLFITFNVVILVLVGFVVTEEQQKGQLRLLLQRAYSLKQLFFAKLGVMATTLFLYLGVYGLTSYLVGLFLFRMPEQSIQFISFDRISNVDMGLYTIAYYGLAYLSIIAVLSLFLFAGTLCPSVNALLAAGVSLLVFLIAVPELMQLSTAFHINVLPVIYASITKVQYSGIALMLLNGRNLAWLLSVITVYVCGFLLGSYLVFTRRSYFN
ncbi:MULTISPECIES: hypothetical protein [Pontibacillus]|uniref:ABC transporter permease n=1 Tax=Pontibacillus chungwhensis TaxID=265426 RepID=A0ABY8UT64_9BACI|nr:MULTISPECIES: hypothetical protein [Pontibacillus]MCD5323316.1 hypothetical protein [Pontibacillus sp. HN14]WIF96697.1 hypothetical protein QNI29_13165 [Pontibacillus chungwhensis]